MNRTCIFLFYFLLSLIPLCRLHAQEEHELPVDRLENLPYSAPDNDFLKLKDAYRNALGNRQPVAAADILRQMGNICYHLGHFAQALEYYLQAERLLEQEHEYARLAANANDMGILYYYNKDMKAARNAYDKAMSLFRRLNDQRGIGDTYGHLGHLFEKQQQYDSALQCQHSALAAYARISDGKGMAKIYENLGSIYEDLERYDSASIYFNRALGLYEREGVQLEKIEVLNNLGDINRKTGRLKEGLHYSVEALQLALQQKERYQVSSAYRDIGKAYHLLHQDDSAFYYLELSRRHLLEIYSEESNKQMAFLQVQYDINKKNQEIERLQADKRANRILAVAVTIVILLLVVLGLAIISRQRIKIRSEQDLGEKNKQFFETQHKLSEAELKSRLLEEDKLKTEIRNRQLEKEKMDAELRGKALEESQLRGQIETKTKELSTHTLHIIQKNQLLEELKARLELMAKDDKRDQKKPIRELIQQINQNFNNDKYWEEFRATFEQIHQSFFEKLKPYSDELTPSEIRLISLLKMNLSSADIATILGISQDSLRVSRYRLRKKLNLDQGENLGAFLQSL
ncbi:tetratricopeptide repeat protein [Taibaiella koreensis]|uniref:tetratricopeptide repeat protein n=1 Tax=Taibaiella koreensis TaxID=1268548 RepID=UPI000E59EEB6|nr:tetratricopeptide repeat protein [Taibaiella koreensis]